MYGINTISTVPAYKTKAEVFKAAHENSDFFDSFGEALSNSWKFYVTK